jgi:hypothetical protein
MLYSAESDEGFRWRAWPCPRCDKDVTPIGFLLGGNKADRAVQHGAESPEEIAAHQSGCLLQWISGCPHREWHWENYPLVAEGSEHLVFLDENAGKVSKLTHPGIFGDSYYIENGRVCQRPCSPLDYLIRLRLWHKLFECAPEAIGMTARGQFVSRQQFISGNLPTQTDVDDFLCASGLIPVKQSCWLWKRAYEEFEIWVGDARAENFVAATGGIVPIDLRLWFVSPS